jgi:glutathione S-transferase
MTETLTFFHAPQSRSSGVAILLDELGAQHDLRLIDMKAGEQRQPAFLAINPMGKVPAILHGSSLVTEQVAVYIYLADLFPEAGLAPALTDPMRGPYLRWTAFYGSCFEPAVVDLAMKREPAPLATSPYGSFDNVIDSLTGQLRDNAFIAGDRLTAADILWCTSLQWIIGFGLLPARPAIAAYVDRVGARPSFARIRERDAAWAVSRASATPPA